MKKIILAVCLVLLAVPCSAQVIFEQVIAVESGVTTIVDIPDDVMTGLVQVSRGGACRMTFGKTTVTSTAGYYLDQYLTFPFYSRGEMVAAMFTADTGNAGSGASLYVVGFPYRYW